MPSHLSDCHGLSSAFSQKANYKPNLMTRKLLSDLAISLYCQLYKIIVTAGAPGRPALGQAPGKALHLCSLF